MKISVALCTYNGEEYLAEQLDSILQQTCPVDEIVICDDQSSDGTEAIIRTFQERGLPIRFQVNPSRLGFIQNFAKATRLCSGDIIFLCDQDDVWLPHKVHTMRLAFLHDPELMLAFSDAQLVDKQGIPLPHNLWECVNLSATSHVNFLDLLNNTRITGATIAFRQSLLEVALPILPCWIHDAWFGIAAAAMGKLLPIPEKLILYRQHDTNQIGIKKTTWKTLTDKILRLATTPHTEHARRYWPLLDRLGSYPEARQHLLQKIQHLDSRQPDDGKYLSVLKGIIRELLNRRYFRYAYGWNSIFRDLILLGWQTIHRNPRPCGTK